MKQENIRLLVSAALGAVSGLLLGMYLFGEEERKGKLSKHLSSLSDLVKELEELKSDEAKELKDQIKNILGSIEKLLEKEDG
ncbi:MAG: hypothetical protein KAT31_04955 [Bacteroidales bacterium]|nr:hypothetical protein [Bacteroidales bacterium]